MIFGRLTVETEDFELAALELAQQSQPATPLLRVRRCVALAAELPNQVVGRLRRARVAIRNLARVADDHAAFSLGCELREAEETAHQLRIHPLLRDVPGVTAINRIGHHERTDPLKCFGLP